MPAARFLLVVSLLAPCIAGAGRVAAGSPGGPTSTGAVTSAPRAALGRDSDRAAAATASKAPDAGVAEPAARSDAGLPGAVGRLAAPVATSISYQGYVTDASGVPLAGAHDLTFQLWDDAVAGAQLGADIHVGGVPVTDGVFTTLVPVDPARFDGQGVWLRVGVDGSWLAPRQPVLPVPYALGLRPGAAVRGDLSAPTLSLTNVSGPALSVGSDLLGIDATGQTALRATGRGVGVEARGMTGLLAEGDVAVQATGTVGVRADSQVGHAVEGTSGSSVGVYGESNGSYGVHGKSHRSSGVYGESADGFSAGVEGHGANGVVGSGAVVGVSGYSVADGMTGVMGTATGNNAKGVVGYTTGYGSTGVSAEAQFGTGVLGEGEIGVQGKGSVGAGVVGEGPRGVSGTSTTGMDAGVAGSSAQSTGVLGESTQGVGVWASGSGIWANAAALRANNTNTSQGVAAYFTNQSAFANTHLYNSGSGEILVLQSSGGRFLGAMGAGWDTRFRMEYNGDAYADGSWNAGGADFAEMLPAVAGLEPGDVLVIGADGVLHRATTAFATGVAGVYSTDPGFVGGQTDEAASAGTVPLAVLGVVPVKASAENGPIAPGDLLATGALAGHAMRAGQDPPQGTVIGKALGGLDHGTGVIRMLVSLQ